MEWVRYSVSQTVQRLSCCDALTRTVLSRFFSVCKINIIKFVHEDELLSHLRIDRSSLSRVSRVSRVRIRVSLWLG